MKETRGDRVRVQIFGREYEMDSGGLTPLEVQSLAGFVDEKMREIASRSNIVDTQKIAVLAAINVSLEYIQLKNKTFPETEDVSPTLDNLASVLEKALSQN